MRAFFARAPVRETRVDHMYSLPVATMSAAELESETNALTLQARSSFGAPPPPFRAWYVADGRLHVPRFYGLTRFGAPAEDARVLGDPVALRFEGDLTDVQQRAMDAVFGRHLAPDGCGGALVCLPCGFGKTVWAVRAIVALGRKACVFVHKAFLRDQWVAAFARFCPEARVGLIQGKTWNVDGYDVVVAMVMTIAKREYAPETMDCFGTICFDECHHMAAPVMHLATRAFRARYVVGLTATKERADGLTPLLHWSLGPEAFRVERDGERARVSVALFPGATREILARDGRPVVSVMINALAAHAGATPSSPTASRRRRAGRVVLVLSDRIAQLRALVDLLIARGVAAEEVGLFTGATRDADRPAQLARPVVLCSYGMANEGLDKREADTCVMATPKGRVTQCIGRVQRPCETKMPPLVLDVADDASVFVHLRHKRQRTYAKERYEVQVLAADAPADAWFA